MALEFPNIDPVAFSLGPLPVRWYALAYLAGFVLGWRYCLALARKTPSLRPNADDIDDYLTWAILAVILGGRLGYILFYQFEFYMGNPAEVLKVWRGGMSYHGGVIGVIVSLYAFTKIKNIPFFRLADLVACAAPIGIFFGRVANFINGELYGRLSDAPWAMVFPHGGDQPRHPSQLYEAGLEGVALFLILFILVRQKAVRERLGVLSGVFLLGYATFRSAVESYRQPDPQIGFIFEKFSMGQMLSVPMIVLGLWLIVRAVRQNPEPAQ